MARNRLLIFPCIALAVACYSCAQAALQLPLVSWEGRTMGSPYRIQIAGANLSYEALSELKQAVDARLAEINRQMSHYQPGSELSRFNAAEAGKAVKISPEFEKVVRFSLEMNLRSGGAFDPTLSPLINLWGFGERGKGNTLPEADAINQALRMTGCKHVSINSHGELRKDIPELSLNLSAAAKGFAVDELIGLLKSRGFINCYASIAGEVRVSGHNARRTKWTLGISSPIPNWRETDPMAGIISVSDLAVSTSGDYQKFVTRPDGRRLSHILDPRTGRPIQHALSGVTVVAPDGMTADALATTLFVLGEKEGLPFVESWTNAAALFISDNGSNAWLTVSSRFVEMTGFEPAQKEDVSR